MKILKKLLKTIKKLASHKNLDIPVSIEENSHVQLKSVGYSDDINGLHILKGSPEFLLLVRSYKAIHEKRAVEIPKEHPAYLK